MKSVLWRIFRTKSPYSVTLDTNLHRCLGVVDLIIIGIGGMVGSGIYVITGITAKEQTGQFDFIFSVINFLFNSTCFVKQDMKWTST